MSDKISCRSVNLLQLTVYDTLTIDRNLLFKFQCATKLSQSSETFEWPQM